MMGRQNPGLRATRLTPPPFRHMRAQNSVGRDFLRCYRCKWSEREDLNLRPSVPQTDALTGLRYAPLSGTLMTIEESVKWRHASRRDEGAGFFSELDFGGLAELPVFVALAGLAGFSTLLGLADLSALGDLADLPPAAGFSASAGFTGFESVALMRSFIILLALKTMTCRGVIGTTSPVLG